MEVADGGAALNALSGRIGGGSANNDDTGNRNENAQRLRSRQIQQSTKSILGLLAGRVAEWVAGWDAGRVAGRVAEWVAR